MKKMNKKGFTLAELLIVVAIIAVLVAISIPIFSSQLEKSREAVDAANIRAEYAEILADAITGEKIDDAYLAKHEVTLKQQTEGWQNSFDFPENLKEGTAAPTKDGKATFTWNADTQELSVNIKLTK